METKSIGLTCVRHIAEGFKLPEGAGETITARQEIVPGFDQQKLEKTVVVMIGAGGLGGEISEGLVRKGVKSIAIFDDDIVEPSNLSRQRFYPKDIYQNKAIALAENLSRDAINKSVIGAVPHKFQGAVMKGMEIRCDIAVCGVDNNPARTFVAKYFYKRRIPVIFTAVSSDADHGYTFIQQYGKACFGCLFPNAINDKKTPCPGTPAVKDILKVMGGLVLYAVDTIVMERVRDWDYKEIFLANFDDRKWRVERRKDCPICSGL